MNDYSNLNGNRLKVSKITYYNALLLTFLSVVTIVSICYVSKYSKEAINVVHKCDNLDNEVTSFMNDMNENIAWIKEMVNNSTNKINDMYEIGKRLCEQFPEKCYG